MTPKKSTAVGLAFLLGWAGAHRLYLGHPIRAFFFLAYPLLTVTVIFDLTGTLAIARSNASLDINSSTLPFLAPIVLLPWLDGIGLMIRSSRYCQQQQGWRTRDAFVAIGLAAVLNVAVYQYAWKVPAQTAAGQAAYTMTVQEFTEQYTADFSHFDGQVIQLTGTLTADEIMLREGEEPARILLMEQGTIPITLRFADAEQPKADTLSLGQTVVVKGVCLAEFELRITLDDCRLIE